MFNPPIQSNLEGKAQHFMAVPAARLLDHPLAVTDLFVRLPNGKMIKFAHKGDKIDSGRVDRYRNKTDKGVLFVNQDSYNEVVAELIKEVKAKAGAKKIDDDQLIAQFFSVAEAVLTEIVQLPITQSALAHIEIVVEEITARLSEPTDLAKALRSVFALNDKFAQDTMATVVIANWLAHSLGWKARRMRSALTMGALLHDIGLKEIPADVAVKKPAEMTKEEKTIYETHPVRGFTTLNQFPSVPNEVLQIVLEHHEVPSGTGFPSQMRGDRIFPMAKVVSFANRLSHDIIDHLIETKELPLEVLHAHVDHVYKPMYGSELCKAIKTVFKGKS
jgi:HD-GYP domain-containing protein (c-di-GMP phosphodiesterase class II)